MLAKALPLHTQWALFEQCLLNLTAPARTPPPVVALQTVFTVPTKIANLYRLIVSTIYRGYWFQTIV